MKLNWKIITPNLPMTMRAMREELNGYKNTWAT